MESTSSKQEYECELSCETHHKELNKSEIVQIFESSTKKIPKNLGKFGVMNFHHYNVHKKLQSASFVINCYHAIIIILQDISIVKPIK